MVAFSCLSSGPKAAVYSLIAFAHLTQGSLLESALQSKAPTSQISKVIDLLKDMKTQVEEETAKGEQEAEDTENACIKDITQLENDVKYNTEKAEEAAATKEDQAAKSAAYASEAGALAPQIGDAEAAKAAAKKEQAEAVATLNKEEAELSEAVTMLTQAYSVLKRSFAGPAFLQKGSSANAKAAFLSADKSESMSGAQMEQVRTAVTALSAVVDAAWVNTGDSNTIKSFLEMENMESDELSLHQPQASVANYENKSGGILAAIESMQEKASAELTKLREKALKGKHAYELLSQDLTSKIEMLTEQMDAAKTSSAEAAANSEKAGAELADTSEAVDSFKTQLTDTTASCDKASADWSARKAEAVEEAGVIQQAVDVLSSKFSGSESLIQLGVSKVFAKKGSDNSEIASREKAANLLRKMSERFENFGFLQAAQSAEADPFTKVRKMINTMIVKLEDEQAAEAAKEGKCQADMSKGKMDVKVKTKQLKKLQARSDKANARVSELATDLTELADTVRMLKANQDTWTKHRSASRTENAAALEEAKTSIEALNSAIGILTEFYGGSAPALVQVAVNSGAAAGKMSEKAEAVIAILQTAQSDFEKIRQTTEKSEADAQASYEKDMQDAKVSLSKSESLIEGKTSEQAAVKVQLEQIDEDLGNMQKAYEAATKFLSAVQEACANKPMTFEERQAKRQSEIEGLRTALSILSGEE